MIEMEQEALCDNLEISARCGCDWEEQKDGEEVMVPQITLFKKLFQKSYLILLAFIILSYFHK